MYFFLCNLYIPLFLPFLNQGTKRIEGLELNMQRHLGVTTPSINQSQIVLETNAFARMHKLKLLRLSHVQLNGCYEELPTGLRMLCWIAFPLDSIPTDFHLENLVVLEMQYSSLRQILNGTKVCNYSTVWPFLPSFFFSLSVRILIMAHRVMIDIQIKHNLETTL
jgi:hypothetical protein